VYARDTGLARRGGSRSGPVSTQGYRVYTLVDLPTGLDEPERDLREESFRRPAVKGMG